MTFKEIKYEKFKPIQTLLNNPNYKKDTRERERKQFFFPF